MKTYSFQSILIFKSVLNSRKIQWIEHQGNIFCSKIAFITVYSRHQANISTLVMFQWAHSSLQNTLYNKIYLYAMFQSLEKHQISYDMYLQ